MASHKKEGGQPSEASALLLSKLASGENTTIQVGDVEDLKKSAGVHPAHDHQHPHHVREVTRLEMWIDALASIVVTITIMPLMDLLNEPKEERDLGIPFLLFSVVLGFLFMSYILINTFLAFNWFEDHHAFDPVLHGLGLLFLAFLSLFAFAVQSLLQSFLDNSAIYFFGGTFIGVFLSCFFIFLYCLWSTDIRNKVSRRSAINSEITFFAITISAFVVMMILSVFISTAYQNYIMYSVLVVLMATHHATRTDANLNAFLPAGFPKERIDVYTDGVYAVAVTLFLIEIKYPSSRKYGDSLALAFLREEWRAVVGHFVSFGVLGVHWCLQNFISAMTDRPTRSMYATSMGHCMAVALFPFTMKLALLGEYSAWEMAGPVLCYCGLAFTQVLLWLRARGSISDKVVGWVLTGVVVLTLATYLGNEMYTGMN